MSAGSRLVAAITALGLPITHRAWPEQGTEGAPPLPWCAWRTDEGGEVFADCSNWAALPRLALELYEAAPDLTLHREIDLAVGQGFGPYRKYEDWVEDEHCLVTTWEFTDTNGKEHRNG